MKLLRFAALFAVLVLVAVGFLSGWVPSLPRSAPPPPAKVPPPAEVTITRPIERDVTELLEFPGRTAAVDNVEVRARHFAVAAPRRMPEREGNRERSTL